MYMQAATVIRLEFRIIGRLPLFSHLFQHPRFQGLKNKHIL